MRSSTPCFLLVALCKSWFTIWASSLEQILVIPKGYWNRQGQGFCRFAFRTYNIAVTARGEARFIFSPLSTSVTSHNLYSHNFDSRVLDPISKYIDLCVKPYQSYGKSSMLFSGNVCMQEFKVPGSGRQARLESLDTGRILACTCKSPSTPQKALDDNPSQTRPSCVQYVQGFETLVSFAWTFETGTLENRP